jgi:hypothetical protein
LRDVCYWRGRGKRGVARRTTSLPSPSKHMPSVTSMTRTRSFQSESHAHNTRTDGQGPSPRRTGRIAGRRRSANHKAQPRLEPLLQRFKTSATAPLSNTSSQRLRPALPTPLSPATNTLFTMQRTYLYRTLTNAICSSCGRKPETRCGSRIINQTSFEDSDSGSRISWIPR